MLAAMLMQASALSLARKEFVGGVASLLVARAEKLSDAEIAKIVTADVVDRQFLATADFTRGLYDEAATFTDEIDTYTMDKFIAGTKKLFVGERSKVELTSPVVVDKDAASFRFQESLCFNVPLKPVVTLSGKVVLTRDPASGLFTAYREYWDQTPNQVLLTARLL